MNINIEKDWKKKTFYAKTPDAITINGDNKQKEFYKTFSNALLSDSIT